SSAPLPCERAQPSAGSARGRERTDYNAVMKLSVKGKTVVITGTVTGMERKEAEARLVGLGARCTSSVSKQTDFVFAMADAGSKKAAAEKLGIPVLSETVLFSLIGTPAAPKQPA